MKYGSEKNALFGGKFVWRCGMGLKVKYINAKRVCVKTKMVYHFVILNSSEGSVYIYLCLQILRFALNDRLSDSAIGVLTHPRFAIVLYIRLCLQITLFFVLTLYIVILPQNKGIFSFFT